MFDILQITPNMSEDTRKNAWDKISCDIGDFAKLSYEDLQDLHATRPLDFPSPVSTVQY